MSFQSWEFLFLYNLLTAILFPLFGRNASIQIVVFLFPGMMGILESFFIPSDTHFFLILMSLHFGLSFLFIKFLFNSSITTKSYYLWLFSSLLLNLLFPLTSLNLIFSDVFWGVVPGTIAIDPIIGLEPYALRLIVALITIGLWLTIQKPKMLILTPLIVMGILSSAFPGWLTQNFYDLAESQDERPSQLRIFSQEKSSQLLWSSEANNSWAKFKQLLPLKEKNTVNRIYVFRSHDEKFNHTGARETQIGHFFQHAMMISEISPSSSLFRHELAHLYHGSVDAPFWTYLDPFVFEGIAVALADQKETILKRATALQKKLKLIEWPRWFKFYQLSPHTSYTFAGSYIHLCLLKNMPIWNCHATPNDLQFEPSLEDITWAEAIFQSKPLFVDPKRRDCARLKRKLRLKPESNASELIKKICLSQ